MTLQGLDDNELDDRRDLLYDDNRPASSSGALNSVSYGTYSPTVTGITNISGIPTGHGFTWVRTGDFLDVHGQLNLAESAGAATEVRVSLPSDPAPVTNFVSVDEASGVGADSQSRGGIIQAHPGSVLVTYKYRAIGTGTERHALAFRVKLKA